MATVVSRHASRHRSGAPRGAVRGQGRLRPVGRPAGRDRRDHQADPGRRAGHRPPRRHRHRQDRDRRVGGRAGPAAGPGDAAQQDAGGPVRQRAAPAVPGQRGRVLRLLLRLLPARGLRPADRHLHREGLLDQRGGRAAAPLGDQLAADPARRDRGRHGLLHLRPRHPAGVRRPDAPGQGRRGARPRRHAAPAGRDAIHPQRHDLLPRQLPGPRRHPRDLPGLRGAPGPHRVLRRPDRAADDAPRRHRRGDHRGPGALRLPGHPLRRRAASGWSGRSAASSSSWRTSSPSSSARASCSRPSDCGCAPPTTSR